MGDLVGLVVGVGGLLVAFASTWFNTRATIRATKLQVGEQRKNQDLHLVESWRLKRFDRLDKLLAELRQARSELQYWQNKGPAAPVEGKDIEKREILYGAAYGVMLSTGLEKLKVAAETMLERPFIEFAKKVQDIDFGIRELAREIEDLAKEFEHDLRTGTDKAKTG